MDARTPFQNYIDRMPFGTQKWIAQQVGLTNHTINRIYKGRHKPCLDTAQKIASVTGLSIQDLVAGSLSDAGIALRDKQRAKRVAAKAS